MDDYRSFLLNNEEQPVEKAHNVESAVISHDYDELYFEPASEEKELLQQLKQLLIPIIPEENLKYISYTCYGLVLLLILFLLLFHYCCHFWSLLA